MKRLVSETSQSTACFPDFFHRRSFKLFLVFLFAIIYICTLLKYLMLKLSNPCYSKDIMLNKITLSMSAYKCQYMNECAWSFATIGVLSSFFHWSFTERTALIPTIFCNYYGCALVYILGEEEVVCYTSHKSIYFPDFWFNILFSWTWRCMHKALQPIGLLLSFRY